MGSKALSSKLSTVAVIVFALGIALVQGKAFAKANETETPAGVTQSIAAPLNPAPAASSNDVKTINLPGAGQGGEDDDEGEDDGEDDDNFGED